MALIYAQFSASPSLRGLEASWNANSQHHYHLASGPLMRSTLSDANKRRPVAVFAETFGLVAWPTRPADAPRRHGNCCG